LGFSGLRGFGSRSNFFLGGYEHSPKTQPFHIVKRWAQAKNLAIVLLDKKFMGVNVMKLTKCKVIESKVLSFACIILLLSICMPVLACPKTHIQNGNVVYDFTFAELTVKYFETGDEKYIEKIAETDAAQHIYGFAKEFSHDVFDYGYPLNSSFDFCKALLTPFEAKKESLSQFSDKLKKSHCLNF